MTPAVVEVSKAIRCAKVRWSSPGALAMQFSAAN